MASPGKPPSDSFSEMVETVLPSDSNSLGSAFGGRIMQWIDLAGALAAQRHCRRAVVTASMDELHFIAPVKIGHWAVLQSRTLAAFKTSMEVGVTVFTEDPLTGDRRLCTRASLTFVALDAYGKPTEVPPVLPQNPSEQRDFDDAIERRAHRLARRRQTEAR